MSFFEHLSTDSDDDFIPLLEDNNQQSITNNTSNNNKFNTTTSSTASQNHRQIRKRQEHLPKTNQQNKNVHFSHLRSMNQSSSESSSEDSDAALFSAYKQKRQLEHNQNQSQRIHNIQQKLNTNNIHNNELDSSDLEVVSVRNSGQRNNLKSKHSNNDIFMKTIHLANQNDSRQQQLESIYRNNNNNNNQQNKQQYQHRPPVSSTQSTAAMQLMLTKGLQQERDIMDAQRKRAQLSTNHLTTSSLYDSSLPLLPLNEHLLQNQIDIENGLFQHELAQKRALNQILTSSPKQKVQRNKQLINSTNTTNTTHNNTNTSNDILHDLSSFVNLINDSNSPSTSFGTPSTTSSSNNSFSHRLLTPATTPTTTTTTTTTSPSTTRIIQPLPKNSPLKGSLVARNAELAAKQLQLQVKNQNETLNIFTLFHIAPLEAAKYVNHDTIQYLRYIRCPTIFPTDPIDKSSLSSMASSSSSSSSSLFHPIQSFIVDQFNRPNINNGNSNNNNTTQFALSVGINKDGTQKPIHFRQQVVLSFTNLIVAKHIVQNIRQFQSPLHNVYCAIRFNTVFPVSLCGGFTMNGTRSTTKVLNSDNPIILDSDQDDDDDGDDNIHNDNDDDEDNNSINKNIDTNTNTVEPNKMNDNSNISQNPIFQLLTTQQRTDLQAHVPFTKEGLTITKLNSKGEKFAQYHEKPLTDTQLQFLYAFVTGKELIEKMQQQQQQQHQHQQSNSNNNNNNNNNNNIELDIDDIDANQYTDGVISSMLDFIKTDVEHDRQLRDMLRPLVMMDIEEDIRMKRIDLSKFQTHNSNNHNPLHTTSSTITTTKSTPYERFKQATQRAAVNQRNRLSSQQQHLSQQPNDDGDDDDDLIALDPTEINENDDDDDDDETSDDEFNNDIEDKTINNTNNNNNNSNITKLIDELNDDDLFSDDEPTTTTTTTTVAKTTDTEQPKQQQLTQQELNVLHRRCLRIPKHASNSEVLAVVMPKFTCPLCLCKVKSNLGSTKCGHLACHSCLRRSVSLVKVCPICRAPMTIKDVFRLFG